MFTVVCEDGRVRHARPFFTRASAREFAEWGHCCTSHHTITGTDVPRTLAAIVERPNCVTAVYLDENKVQM